MWTCTQCKETSPEDFGLCWECQTLREDVVLAPESEPDAPRAEPTAEVCPRCNAPRLMDDLPVVGPATGNWKHPAIEVEVSPNPHPLLARGSVRAELRARVCAACGHTELFTLGAGALWSAWRMLKQPATPPRLPPPIPTSVQSNPIGVRCELRANQGSGPATDFLPRSGSIVSIHTDPGSDGEWFLMKLDRAVEGTMQIGDATRYQRVEADVCLLRSVGRGQGNPRFWKGQAVQSRWVQRGAWKDGERVQAEGVLPIFNADCSAEPGP